MSSVFAFAHDDCVSYNFGDKFHRVPSRGGYQPPATPDNASAKVNGMQFSVNAGDD